jgi:hypothetical protein
VPTSKPTEVEYSISGIAYVQGYFETRASTRMLTCCILMSKRGSFFRAEVTRKQNKNYCSKEQKRIIFHETELGLTKAEEHSSKLIEATKDKGGRELRIN